MFSENPKIGFLAHARKFEDALTAGQILAPAKTLAEMQRVINNDYVDATLAALFVAVVVAMSIFGLVALMRALGTPSITSAEAEEADALPGVARG